MFSALLVHSIDSKNSEYVVDSVIGVFSHSCPNHPKLAVEDPIINKDAIPNAHRVVNITILPVFIFFIK